MFPLGTRLAAIFMLSLLAMLEANPLHKKELEERNTTTTTRMSPWLKRVTSPNPRATGCGNRPWICNKGGGGGGGGGGEFPPVISKSCCMNRCVDVSSDMNHCGSCGIRCPFNWQCCYGLCINTNADPFHCGDCRRRCSIGSLCFYGLCGYAQPFPPFPFPIPFPPFPFPPKNLLSPLPPKKPISPFPPKPPKPRPPFSPKN